MRIKQVNQHPSAQPMLASILVITDATGCPAQLPGFRQHSSVVFFPRGAKPPYPAVTLCYCGSCSRLSSPEHPCQRVLVLDLVLKRPCKAEVIIPQVGTGAQPPCCLLQVREGKESCPHHHPGRGRSECSHIVYTLARSLCLSLGSPSFKVSF